MSTKKPETLLVGKIMKYLGTVPNCCYEKRHGSMYAASGQPDISACIDGRRVEIEVKVPSAAAIKRADPLVYMPNWVRYDMERAQARARRVGGGGRFGTTIGNQPTELQIERLIEWERAGAVAFVAYSVEAVREVVEKLERWEIK